MDQEHFAQRLAIASRRARDFASNYIIEPLPEALAFNVELNGSYDGNPLHPDELVYPDDSRLARKIQHGLSARDFVRLLWREGRVPEWIDLCVGFEDGQRTFIKAFCCGRFTANEHLLYHEQEGYPPFHVTSPPLPIGWESLEESGKFSLYWSLELNAPELGHIRHPGEVKLLRVKGLGVTRPRVIGLFGLYPETPQLKETRRETFSLLADILREQNRGLEEALRLTEKLLEDATPAERGVLLVNRGEILMNLGQLGEARRALLDARPLVQAGERDAARLEKLLALLGVSSFPFRS